MLTTYSVGSSGALQKITDHIDREGFEPNVVIMNARQLASPVEEIGELGFWNYRQHGGCKGQVLIRSPWGFCWLNALPEFHAILGNFYLTLVLLQLTLLHSHIGIEMRFFP